MMGLSIGHIVLFAIIILVIFGTAKLKNFGKDVGGAVKDFKKSVKEDEANTTTLTEARTLEHQATTSSEANTQIKH